MVVFVWKSIFPTQENDANCPLKATPLVVHWRAIGYRAGPPDIVQERALRAKSLLVSILGGLVENLMENGKVILNRY